MAEGERFIENNQIVGASVPKDYTGAAATIEYLSLKNYDNVVFLIYTGAWAGGTAAVTLKQATAVAGTGAKALAFTRYFTNDAAATSPTLVETSCSSTFNLDTANSLYIIEVAADQLDRANSFDCVSCQVASPGQNADLYAVIAIAGEARYASAPASLPSSVID